MSLTRTQIRTLARKMASDTDATNPFWSDTDVNVLMENWQADMSSYLRYPRAESAVITQVVGQDDYDLPADWLSTIRIIMYDSSNNGVQLAPKTEDEISEVNPNWRNAASGTPRYYFAANTITPAAVLTRKYFIYPAPDKANSMLHIYVKVPTAISVDTAVPVFPAPMHILAVYYVAWMMLLPLNKDKADSYQKIYEKERNRMCGEGRKETEKLDTIMFK